MKFKEWFMVESIKWPLKPYTGYTSTICSQDYLAKLANKSPSCILDKQSGKGSHWTVYNKQGRVTIIPQKVSPQICKNVYNSISDYCG